MDINAAKLLFASTFQGISPGRPSARIAPVEKIPPEKPQEKQQYPLTYSLESLRAQSQTNSSQQRVDTLSQTSGSNVVINTYRSEFVTNQYISISTLRDENHQVDTFV